jgi:two-component system, NtrC family, response regulator AtoC
MSPPDPSELELWLLDSNSSRAIPLPKAGRLVVGRAPECDVVVDDPSVSRRHAVLEIGEALSIEDLDSANGTWLHAEARGAPASAGAHGPMSTRPGLVPASAGKPRPLSIGQGLLVGAVLLVVRARKADTPSPASPGAASTGARRAEPILSEPNMKALYATAERVAGSDLSVLILGETGVGKEILAEAIHQRSKRSDRPMLRLHCASLSSSLLESELFGHEQGAFTGATRAKVGLLQSADGGTIFLDEVGELPLDFQVKLLRVLEARTLTRVGGLKPIHIDVRFVAATNRDLRREVALGHFREDLLYRLDGVTLVIPPLRERRGEIPALAQTFAAEASRSLGLARPPALSPESIATLLRHDWPGNVRELRHLLERAVVLCQGDAITPADLLPSFGSSGARALDGNASGDTAPPRAAGGAEGSLPDEIAGLERRRIEEALERCGGNQSRAAELLGISRRTLVTRLAAFGMPRPRKPSSS